ncbi:MAG: signal peptidase I [Saccharospirillaceae bacterium]|nr:signal peptidase I [Pseudomonadales bacterium]NRB77949.1 signal peptidase I [Saccharospirillaceae bacterium]
MENLKVIKWTKKSLNSNKGLLIFLVLMVIFRSAIADWNTVPTASMNPTIVEGDRILVNKLAYDLRVPFSGQSIVKLADPIRGDIIIFNSKVAEIRLVKRVIGVAGDSVKMINNELYINDQKLTYQNAELNKLNVQVQETLFGNKYNIQHNINGSEVDSFAEVIVPENQYLVLGDNRDNSADSRFIGFVSRDEIIGRTNSVVLSLNYANYYIPRLNRFFKKL